MYVQLRLVQRIAALDHDVVDPRGKCRMADQRKNEIVQILHPVSFRHGDHLVLVEGRQDGRCGGLRRRLRTDRPCLLRRLRPAGRRDRGHEWQQNETAHPHQPTHAATPAPRSCSVAGSSIRAQRSSADGRAPARRVRWRADLVGPQIGTSLPPIRRRIQARDAEEHAGDPVPTARIHPDDQPDCDRPHRRTGIKVSDDELAAVNITRHQFHGE
jgi:hypothetical protein